MDQDVALSVVIEAALLTSPTPLTMADLSRLFDHRYTEDRLMDELGRLAELWRQRGLRLVEVAEGWSFRTADEVAPYLQRLIEEKTPRLSRAVMETLAIIAYRQPTTRGDIEEIRGVAANPAILRQLEERGWIEVVGRRQTPGRPALYATTGRFLTDLGLKALSDLPPLRGQEAKAEEFELDLPDPGNLLSQRGEDERQREQEHEQ